MAKLLWWLWIVNLAGIMGISHNPTYLDKPFYVTNVNEFVWEHILGAKQSCIMAKFIPVHNDYYFFHFSSFDQENFRFFEGTLIGIPDKKDCFTMISEHEYHNNLTFCFREYDEFMQYIYVTDVRNRTGFALVQSLQNHTSTSKVSNIITELHPKTFNISTTLCPKRDQRIHLNT